MIIFNVLSFELADHYTRLTCDLPYLTLQPFIYQQINVICLEFDNLLGFIRIELS